jgi:hypothetical protein
VRASFLWQHLAKGGCDREMGTSEDVLALFSRILVGGRGMPENGPPQSRPSTDAIWEATLDGRYLCKVVRVSGRIGHLTVRDHLTDTELLAVLVPLAYGAKYGPDVDDVGRWQRTAELAIADQNPEPPPHACPTCGIRTGLGTCGTCMVRSGRGVDGLDDWIRTALLLLDSIPESALTPIEGQHRAWLLAWARGREVPPSP